MHTSAEESANSRSGSSTASSSAELSRRSEEHTSELQSPDHLVCRLLLEKKKHKRYLQSYDGIVTAVVIKITRIDSPKTRVQRQRPLPRLPRPLTLRKRVSCG